MDGDDEPAKEAAPADEEEEALDFTKKKKKARASPLPPRLRAPSGAFVRPDDGLRDALWRRRRSRRMTRRRSPRRRSQRIDGAGSLWNVYGKERLGRCP